MHHCIILFHEATLPHACRSEVVFITNYIYVPYTLNLRPSPRFILSLLFPDLVTYPLGTVFLCPLCSLFILFLHLLSFLLKKGKRRGRKRGRKKEKRSKEGRKEAKKEGKKEDKYAEVISSYKGESFEPHWGVLIIGA